MATRRCVSCVPWPTTALATARPHTPTGSCWSATCATPTAPAAPIITGQALLDAGDRKSARKVADALISSDTPQAYWLARGFILYSDILRAEGNTFEADEYLKSLRTNYPGTEADIFEMIDTRLK